MVVREKNYEHPPDILWNLVMDIVEMRKGKIKDSNAENMTVDTEMYGIKTQYVFRIAPSPTGAVVTVETEGESEDDRRRVELMFATLENMLGPFEKPLDPK